MKDQSRRMPGWVIVTALVAMLLVNGAFLRMAWAVNASTDLAASTRLSLPVTVQRRCVDDDGTAGTTVTVIPAQGAGIKIKVWGGMLSTGDNTTVQFKSATNKITGPMSINTWMKDAPDGNSILETAIPLIETNTNEALVITTGTATQLSGVLLWTASN